MTCDHPTIDLPYKVPANGRMFVCEQCLKVVSFVPDFQPTGIPVRQGDLIDHVTVLPRCPAYEVDPTPVVWLPD